MRFTIEIDEDWLETLTTLTELVLNQEVSSPEEALEKAIFTQIEHQCAQDA